MLRAHRTSTAGAAYLVTSTVRGRQPLFVAETVAVAACVAFVDVQVLGDNHLLAWVLMPDHVHWLIRLGARDRLSNLVNRMKSASARGANRERGVSGPLWSQGFHERCLRSDSARSQAAHYIALNPVRAGLVKHIHAYPYSHLTWPQSRSSVGAGHACD